MHSSSRMLCFDLCHLSPELSYLCLLSLWAEQAKSGDPPRHFKNHFSVQFNHSRPPLGLATLFISQGPSWVLFLKIPLKSPISPGRLPSLFSSGYYSAWNFLVELAVLPFTFLGHACESTLHPRYDLLRIWNLPRPPLKSPHIYSEVDNPTGLLSCTFSWPLPHSCWYHLGIPSWKRFEVVMELTQSNPCLWGRALH